MIYEKVLYIWYRSVRKKNIEKENVKIIEIEGNRKWLPSGDLFNNGGRRLPGGAPAVCGVWGRRFP